MEQSTQLVIAKHKNPVAVYLKNNGGILIALGLMLAIISVTSPYFWTGLNMKSLLMLITTTSLLGLGMTTLLITGYIDLSPGSTFAFAGVLLCKMIEHWGMNFYVALFATLLVSVLLGILMGGIIAYSGMPAFIVTLAMDGIKRGVAYLISGSSLKIYSLNESLKAFGNNNWFGIPIPAYIIVFCCILVAIILSRTVTGRHLYATGGNQNAAINAGVNVKKTCMIAYAMMGFLAGLAGCISAAKVSSGQPTAGTDIMSDAVAAAVLGGTAFSGGKGTVLGTMTGVILIGVACNALNLLEVSYYWQMAFKGTLILAAVYIDTIKQHNEGKIKRLTPKKNVAHSA